MQNLGILSLFSFVILNSIAGVWIHSLLQTQGLSALLAVSFSILTLMFFLWNVSRGLLRPSAGWLPFRKDLVRLNLSAVVGWGGFFYALKHLEPAVVVSLTSGLGIVFTSLFEKESASAARFSRGRYAQGGMFLLLGLMVVGTLIGESGIGAISLLSAVSGLLAAMACALANIFNTKIGKRLSDQGIRAGQILPMRFFLLIALSLLLSSFNDLQLLLSAPLLFDILLFTLLAMALPTLCYQLGIQLAQPFTAMAIHSMIPIFVLAWQLFDLNLKLSYFSLIGATTLPIVSIAYQTARLRK